MFSLVFHLYFVAQELVKPKITNELCEFLKTLKCLNSTSV